MGFASSPQVAENINSNDSKTLEEHLVHDAQDQSSTGQEESHEFCGKIIYSGLACDEGDIIIAVNVHNSESSEMVNPFSKLEVHPIVSASVVETTNPGARKKNVINPVLRSLGRTPRGAALLAEGASG